MKEHHGLTIVAGPKEDIVLGNIAGESRSSLQGFVDKAVPANEGKLHSHLLRLPYGESGQGDIHLVEGHHHLTIHLEAGSRGTLHIHSAQQSKAVEQKISLLVEEGAQLDLTLVNHQGQSTHLLEDLSFVVQKDATFTLRELLLGPAYAKVRGTTSLRESGATITHHFYSLSRNDQVYDISLKTSHDAPETHSDLVMRGVLDDESQTVFQGTTTITQDASGSEGFESQELLTLSPRAEADAIPNLLIHNHDVKCSHGSTIGQVDPESLFYLMSRGLSEEEAKRTIILGYFSPTLDSLGLVELKESLSTYLAEATA